MAHLKPPLSRSSVLTPLAVVIDLCCLWIQFLGVVYGGWLCHTTPFGHMGNWVQLSKVSMKIPRWSIWCWAPSMVVCQLASNCPIGMGFNIASSYTDGMPNCRLNGRMDGDEVAYYYYETTTVVRKSMVCELACKHFHERCDPIPFHRLCYAGRSLFARVGELVCAGELTCSLRVNWSIPVSCLAAGVWVWRTAASSPRDGPKNVLLNWLNTSIINVQW